MCRRRPLLDLPVSQLLRRCPGGARVFIALGTQCVGCPMAGFCTLRDVAASYGLDPDRLVRLLETEEAAGG